MRIELTLRGDYAVRAALAITLLDDGHPVSARRIAERMDIPTRFLAHVLTDLVRAGVVVGTTGRNGGYRLTLRPGRYGVRTAKRTLGSGLSPRIVVVPRCRVARVDFDLDTGIR